MSDRPDIQLIANVVITNAQGQVLLTRYRDDDDRWWLPGAELEPYEHPDAACARALAELGVTAAAHLHHVESFRGRRGWHVMFNYRCPALVEACGDAWHAPDALPPTAHGDWELGVIKAMLNQDGSSLIRPANDSDHNDNKA
jgi:ADP-ribose pyrophosphatase YjhB (NUDIX family)